MLGLKSIDNTTDQSADAYCSAEKAGSRKYPEAFVCGIRESLSRLNLLVREYPSKRKCS